MVHYVAAIDTALWHGLAFARSLDGRSPWVAKQLRRGVLLLWWTATFQLHTHARYWLRARLLRRAAPAPAQMSGVPGTRPTVVPPLPAPVTVR